MVTRALNYFFNMSSPQDIDYLDYLPNELIVSIFMRLDIPELIRMSEVSKRYCQIAHDKYIWRNIAQKIGYEYSKEDDGLTIKRKVEVIAREIFGGSVTRDEITIEKLKGKSEVLKKDVLKVWRAIQSQATIIPTASFTPANFDEIEKLDCAAVVKAFDEWILANEDKMDVSVADLSKLGLAFLPSTIGALKRKLTVLDSGGNNLKAYHHR